LDLNSCSPSTKRSSAEVIEAASARYVDVAVMAPVHPKLNHVPCLMAGPHATEIAAVLADLPMTVRVISGEVGAASSIKMIRSVMIKGLEALTSECVLAAVAAGVEDEVLASLNAGADFDWGARAAYNFDRMIVHGARRAAEMEEVAKTLDDLGLPNDITRSTVLWQRRIADLGLSAPQTPLEDGPVETANTLLSELRRR
jgi:3-hydroxyisobutyrate dehydrogenase-like beta-hydroxyacid dehydrogenase